MIKKITKFRGIAFAAVIVILFSACGVKNKSADENSLKVGFDVDDTLLFSTPAFQKGFESSEKPFSGEFWAVVNNSDRGNSKIKKKVLQILEKHRVDGDEIYAITARKPNGGEGLKNYLNDALGIPKSNIYFESEGKTNRLQQLGIDIFYGDSDSDISDANAAGIKAYRIERSTASSYQKKYNPGKYGEKVIKNSDW
ncbi:MAG: hypothetical protein PF545_00695 [Elusimicrobia bacterium]|jgi:acid phosphatase (class B)|nr:hypothetical protein [Elusimicrobiota bacterium]